MHARIWNPRLCIVLIVLCFIYVNTLTLSEHAAKGCQWFIASVRPVSSYSQIIIITAEEGFYIICAKVVNKLFRERMPGACNRDEEL